MVLFEITDIDTSIGLIDSPARKQETGNTSSSGVCEANFSNASMIQQTKSVTSDNARFPGTTGELASCQHSCFWESL